MDNTKEEVEVIELENSEDEDTDIDLITESVPFREKVEKWLIACNGARAMKHLKDSEAIFQEETVVVKEVIDETESLHSVDTEQYIKSNRKKTTTKITTTTIKKYYSLVNEAKNSCNNNDECGRQPRLKIRDVMATNAAEKDSNRKSTKKPSESKRKESKTSRKRRRIERKHQTAEDCDINHPIIDNDCERLEDSTGKEKTNDRTNLVRKCRTPYNTRLNEDVPNTNLYSADTESNVVFAEKKPKRPRLTRKRNQTSTRGIQVKLKPSNDRTGSVRDSFSVEATKKNTSTSKSKTGSLRNTVNYRFSSDSEQDDILLTSYKPFSLVP